MDFMKINTENWSYSHYYSEPLRAFVSLGASPVEGTEKVQIQYLVTLTDKDYQELFQSTHDSLEAAIEVLNDKYSNWQFLDGLNKTEGDGCTTCAAH